jgi:hypothetical protein
MLLCITQKPEGWLAHLCACIPGSELGIYTRRDYILNPRNGCWRESRTATTLSAALPGLATSLAGLATSLARLATSLATTTAATTSLVSIFHAGDLAIHCHCGICARGCAQGIIKHTSVANGCCAAMLANVHLGKLYTLGKGEVCAAPVRTSGLEVSRTATLLLATTPLVCLARFTRMFPVMLSHSTSVYQKISDM